MRAAGAAVLLLVAGCATPPPVQEVGAGDRRAARLLLEAAHAAGPVAARLVAAPAPDPDAATALLAAAGSGVPFLPVRFVAGAGEPHLVLALAPRPTSPPCAPVPGGGDLVRLAFCDGDRLVAAVEAAAGDDLERQVQRLSRTLFPDLYAERYGVRLGPFPVTFSGSFGFGR